MGLGDMLDYGRSSHPGASEQFFASERHVGNKSFLTPTADKKIRTEKPAKMRLYQAESHRMRQLALNGAVVHMPQPPKVMVNPIWQTFPTKCVETIRSVEEMKQKLQYFNNSSDVMVVRYTQHNCTACNAAGKTFEYICHDQKKHLTNLHFFDIVKEETPELVKGLVRFPQIKGFSAGHWVDLDFKPRESFREELYQNVEREVRELEEQGTPVTALEAEEMYFSACGPAMRTVMEESIIGFYMKSKARLHNYWKQVSTRRSWFYTKFIQPQVPEQLTDEWRTASVFGEKIVMTVEPLKTDF